MALPAAASAMGRNTVPQTAPQPSADVRLATVPFVRAALKARFAGETKTVTLGTAVQSMQHVIPAVGGWNRWIELLFVCTTSANAAAVTFAADGPWNVATLVTLKDAGQKPLYTLRGIDAYFSELLGGYHLFKTDGSSRSYVATTGAVGAGGSFTFSLWIPQEMGRDGLGSYPNMDASQRLSVDITINLNASIYGVAPTTPGSLAVTPIVHYYARPAEIDADGRPQETVPAGAGTVQYWRSLVATVNSGANISTFNLSGRYIRNCLALFTDGSDVRSDTVNPTSMRVELDNGLVYDAPRTSFDVFTWKFFGVDNPTGLMPILLGSLDPDRSPGGEWADDWWRTATSSQLTLKYSAGAAGKLYLLLNEVEPVGNVFR